VLLSARRDLAAARRFFILALRAGTIPAEVTADRPRLSASPGRADPLSTAYRRALREQPGRSRQWPPESAAAADARTEASQVRTDHLCRVRVRAELRSSRIWHFALHAGDAPAACYQYNKVLAVREQVLGAERPQTLTTRGNLANWTGQAGDTAGARDQYAALLPVLERIFGSEHPETKSAHTNFSHWNRRAVNASSPEG
jgi:hypothetical protein